jgi:REP element-mobilizing transposase RayT
MDKFQNKYRIPSARLQSWDYGANGAYFITICTAHREHYFGEIVELGSDATVETPNLGVSIPTTITKMQLNEIGKLAEQFWMEIPNHFPFIELGNFVVMPNHVHGILIIDKNDNGLAGSAGSVDSADTMDSVDSVVETPNLGVSTEKPNAIGNANAIAKPNANVNAIVNAKPNAIGNTNVNVNANTNADANKTNRTANASEKWKPNTIGSIVNQYKRICTINARKIHADFAWQTRFHDHIIRDSAEFERIQNYIANNPLNWKDDKFYG